jgi:hypothetical protein
MTSRLAYEESYAGLLPLLMRIDERLAAAVAAADRVFAARAAGDLYRGLAISPADVSAALNRTPGEPFLSVSTAAYEIAEDTRSLSLRRLLWLQSVYGLTDTDLDILLLGLAPEIDLRYERLYAYLQDDVSRRRPSIDLALNVLCASAGEKLQQRGRFAPDAPLVCHRLIELSARQPAQPLLARSFCLDEQIVRFLLLDDGMDSRLAELSCVESPADRQNDQLLSAEILRRLQAIAKCQSPSSIRLCFEGPANCGQAQAVASLAAALNLSVLRADLTPSAAPAPAITDEVLFSLVREARLRGALLHLKDMASQADASAAADFDALWTALRALPVPFVIESECSWVSGVGRPPGMVKLLFSTPAIAQREACWRQHLSKLELGTNDEWVSLLAERYRLNFSQIEDAAALGLEGSGLEDLSLSARAQTRHVLAKLASHIQSGRDWNELILPDDAIAQLREVCSQFVHRQKVLDDWGFGRKLSYGKGINVLFTGPPGTGKTMAAEVVAKELGLDLYKIDLASVVSKYIGETEKNLERIFGAALKANAILFFDEADALFGKRSEVKDAHDRYANQEISYLLQKMEQYEGIAILATNLRQNLDEAFVRRLAFIVHFPFPDEVYRGRIWAGVWPSATPLSADVDLMALAKHMKLSGGNIKNVGLAAAYLAAADGGVITMEHLRHASQREYQKLGKTLSPTDLCVTSISLRNGGLNEAKA